MQQDERKLLHEMYEEYLVPLKKYAVKLGAHYDDVEDLVHETFLEYLERYPLDWSGKLKTAMLIRILRSRFADMNRKRRRCETLSIDDPVEEEIINQELLENDIVRNILDHEVLDKLMYHKICGIIKEMKTPWRDVLTLRLIADLTTEETCEILHISATVCRSRLSRGKKDLQKRLEKAGIMHR